MRAREFINEDFGDTIKSIGTSIKNAFSGSFSVKVPSETRGADVKDIQQTLEALGYSVGPPGIDGIIGQYTKAAIMKYQQDNNLPATGNVTQDFVDTMNSDLSKHPEIASKLKPATDDEGPSSSGGYAGLALKDPDFMSALQQTASNLGVETNALLGIMKLESNLNPQAVNKYTKATGLIQFMPSTARGLGTSTAELYNMSASEQMQYVEKYLRNAGVRSGMGIGDIYLAVFMPAMLGKDDNHVISTAGKKVYDQNPSLDHTKDGVLTVADVKQSAQRFA
jgi:peptidoglycan hydrolase-like protein with peptidoglycan-binding domain